jgi:fatty-acyl-CoA synthase
MLNHTVGSLLEQCCASHAGKVAIRHGDRTLTYAQLLSDVRRTGRALMGLGLERGDRVAVLMQDCPEVLTVVHGAQWAGLATVALNARLGAEDHAHILADAGARVLVHDPAHAERAAAIAEEAGVELVVVTGDGLDALLESQSDGPGRPPSTPEDLLGLYYTGGTTGRPKGVAHTHRSMIAAWVSELLEMGLGERESFAHVAPLTHASGAFVMPVLLRGGTNVILGGFDPDRLLHAIEHDRVTSTLMVPTMLYVLLDTPGLAHTDLSSLRTVIYGAAPMGRERLEQGIGVFGPVFSQLYGQTEAPNQLAVLSRADHADAVAAGHAERLSSCGRETLISEVRVAGADGEEVAPGDTGEIIARGPHLMREYWNKPEETAEALRDGWLHTGDLARRDEQGYLYIVDRTKDLIISGGFNVYPKEIEQALFSHPAVRDACVIGVPDDKWGEAVKAVVVADGVDAAALQAWVKERKGSVMTPKSIDFLAEIPLTALGKHDKPALRRTYWAGRDRAVN